MSQTIWYLYSVGSLADVHGSGGYNLVATTTLLLCDILVTFPREKLYIWSYNSRVNWTTLFYIITRYLPFIVNMICLLVSLFEGSEYETDCTLYTGGPWAGSEVCSSSQGADMAFSSPLLLEITFSILYIVPWFVVLGCTEILFVRRIVALHHSSRLLSYILVGLLICELISALALLFYFNFFESTFGSIVISIVSPLFGSKLSILGVYFALPEVVFQAFLVMLIMKKVISDWKSGTARSNLGSILIRDGLWSYFCNLCGLLVILIQPAWLYGPFNRPNILWSYASFSVTSSRLILNIRAAAANRAGPTLNETSTGAWTRFTFVQNIRSFLTSTNDELSTPYHYNDFERDSDSDSDD